MTLRLSKASQIRRLLARVINDLNDHEVTSLDDKIKKAKTIGYLSSVQLTCIKDHELQEQMEELEKQIKLLKGGKNETKD